jgi:uncharacterized protein (TIGR02145 family)
MKALVCGGRSASLRYVLFAVLAAAFLGSALVWVGCGGGGTGKGGTLTDPRDKQKYRTVIVNGTRWMAENLNYDADDSKCYEDRIAYCEKYGRLYDIDAILSACPAGWRLPNDDEWSSLVEAAGGINIAGRNLKSQTGWEHPRGIGNGTDLLGFSALPGGIFGCDGESTRHRRKNEGSFNRVGGYGGWWGITQAGDSTPISVRYMDTNSDSLSIDKFYPDDENEPAFLEGMFSIRCVRDKNRYTLTVESNSTVGGTVSPTRVQNITVGKPIDITATANDGFWFGGWGGTAAAMPANPDSAVTTVTLNADATLIAFFLQQRKIPGAVLVDPRDQQEYSTVKIGDLTWMAQNLNYEMENSIGYRGQHVDAGYGRLYTWEAAMSACPVGWRLPTSNEWHDLLFISGEPTRLRSKTGWLGNATSGTDDLGFSALPGGGYHDRRYNEIGHASVWWSATEQGPNAIRMRLDAWDRDIGLDVREKNRKMSVRCVRK